jgi:hypothetical protein
LSVRLRGVPFAQDLQYLAVLATGATGCSIALVDTAVCRMAEGHTLAGGALNAVTLDRAEPGADRAGAGRSRSVCAHADGRDRAQRRDRGRVGGEAF